MSSERYIPLISRLAAFIKTSQAELAQARPTNPLLIALSRKFHRDPTILLSALLLILASILLLNPEGIAPGIASLLAFLPALTTLRHIDRPGSQVKAEQSKFLLDYWVCIGTSFVIEQIFTQEIVGGLIPVWWLVKGMAGIMVWMSASGGPRGVKAGPPRNLSLDRSKARSNDDILPEPEPSPSPVAEILSAFLQGSNQSAPINDSPIDTASFLHDNAAPFTVLSPDKPKSGLNLGKIDAVRLETARPHQPSSPRDQLDAFLDSTATTYNPSTYSDPPLSTGPTGGIDWSERSVRKDAEGSDGEMSPAFIVDASLARSDEYPLERLPPRETIEEREDKGKGEERKRDMTLDDLLAMEQEAK